MEPENPLLDDFLLSLTRSRVGRPRVCFVPTASGDAEGYVERFETGFGKKAEVSVLRLFSREHADLRRFVLHQDALFVGGGNTASLLAVWRAHGLDEVLTEAHADGVVLAGLSAGMNCWFEASVTDSFGEGLAPLLDGMGLVAGSACPHYDGEELRAPTYRSLIAGGFPAGHAADDGCALLFEDGVVTDVVSSRPSAAAYYVERDASGEVREQRLDARYLGSGHSEPPSSRLTLS